MGQIEKIDTVVVGGGQAGLAMSYHLKRLGREHVVIERGRIGESWRSERWDSLMFQFPSSSIQLPGYSYKTDQPDGYVPKDEIVRFLENYAKVIGAPLHCGLTVNALHENSGRLRIETEQGASFEVANVIVATGPFQRPQNPDIRRFNASRSISGALAGLPQSKSTAAGSGAGRRQRGIGLPNCGRAPSRRPEGLSFGRTVSQNAAAVPRARYLLVV
jgi:choline dehydrogenase-like flavoprotein